MVVIDVGSSNVVIAAGQTEPGGKICIKGIVSKSVDGVESGRIDNSDMVCQAIAAAKSEIEERLGIGITEAYAGISGEFVRCAQITDHVYVEDDSQNSNNVTQRDVDALDRRMRSVKVADDRETVMTSEPLRYMVDRREVKAPVGSFGKVLSAVYNFVLCDKIMRERLISVIQRSGITVKEVVPNALVAPLAVANSDEMHDGVATVDLGGGVTDVTVCYGGKIHGLDTYRRAGRQCRHTLVQHTREICRGAESELRPCTGRRCSERQHNIPARLAHHKEHPEQEPRYHNRSAHERDRRARTARDTRLGLRAEALVGRDTDGRLVVDARH